MSFINNQINLNRVEERFISQTFNKGYKKLCRILQIGEVFKKVLGSLDEVDGENAQKILKQLKVWGLHYLTKGARIPLLHQHGSLHLSFIDYLNNDNEATYYRGDGGAIIKAFKSCFKEKYLSQMECRCQCGMVKSAKFQDLIKAVCRDKEMEHFYGGTYTYRETEEMEHLQVSSDSQRVFFDVSNLLKPAFMHQRNWASTLKEIQQKVEALPETCLVGGIVPVGQGVSVYLIFHPSKEREEGVQENIDNGFIGKFKNFRGAIGAYPDIMLLKHALVEQGYDLHALLGDSINFSKKEKLSLIESSSSKIDHLIEEQFKSVLLKLEKFKESNNPLFSIYLGFIFNLISVISDKGKINQCKDNEYNNYIQSLSLAALSKLSKHLDKIVEKESRIETEDFSEATQRIYLALEEVLFLLCLYSPGQEEELKPLSDQLSEIFPCSEFLQDKHIARHFLTYSSGMASLDYVLAAHLEARGIQEEKPRVVLLEGSYYEIAEDTGFKGYHAGTCEITCSSASEFLSSSESTDVMYLDLYPNFVTLKEVKVNPVVDLVSHALSKRKGDEPLTVVLDTSTTLFYASEIRDIIKELKQPISEGRLNLVIASSLAKFCGMGLDKYAGGLVEVYGNSDSLFFDKMQGNLRKKAIQDPISLESQRFFSLLFSTSLDQLGSFYGRIRENTHLLYENLKNEMQQENCCIELAKRDPQIPMLGLHFDNFIKEIFPEFKEKEHDTEKFTKLQVRFTKLMEFYLYHKAHAEKLPVHIRGSFPFPHAAIVECHTALRFVVGLEEEGLLGKYSNMLKEANLELKAFMSMEELKEGLVELLAEGDDEAFNTRVTEQIPELGSTKKVSFEEFVRKLIS